jgi:replicative DNA helicase
MAQIIIAKHRKGATGDVLLTFRGEFTRFENPEDRQIRRTPDNGGEIIGTDISGGIQGTPLNSDPFAGEPMQGDRPLPF